MECWQKLRCCGNDAVGIEILCGRGIPEYADTDAQAESKITHDQLRGKYGLPNWNF